MRDWKKSEGNSLIWLTVIEEKSPAPFHRNFPLTDYSAVLPPAIFVVRCLTSIMDFTTGPHAEPKIATGSPLIARRERMAFFTATQERRSKLKYAPQPARLNPTFFRSRRFPRSSGHRVPTKLLRRSWKIYSRDEHEREHLDSRCLVCQNSTQDSKTRNLESQTTPTSKNIDGIISMGY